MDKKEIILQLKNILNTAALTDDQKKVVERAIVLLENNYAKDRLIDAAKILSNLLSVGVKIFDP